MKKIIVLVAFIFISLAQANAAADEASISKEKHDDIMKLLEVLTVGSDCDKFLDMFFNDLKNAYPEIPLAELERIRIIYFDRKPLLEKGAEIYARHFTHDEIKDILAFYNTSAGKKLISTRGEMTMEARRAFQAFGEETQKKIYDELLIKGYIKETKDGLTK